MTRQWQRAIALGTATALAVSLGLVASAPASAAPKPATAQQDKSVPVKSGKATKAPAAAESSKTITSLPAPKWPAAGSATVDLATGAAARAAAPGPVRAGKLPVSVAPVAPSGADAARRPAEPGPKRVKVDVLDRAATERAGVTGVALRVKAEEGSGPAAVSVDYGDFAGGLGGDYAARLRVVPLPECALSTPEKEECQPGDPLPGRNDTRNRRVTAEVQTTAAGTMLAVAAGPSGAAGNFAATPLSPSATWQVSAQTGDFSWSYDLDVPPALNGPEPDLGISYSSSSVDGRTASTNAQPSWVGEGFDLSGGGFVERSYVPCSEDGAAGSPKRGDLCFTYENATMSLGGKTTELVKDDTTGKWRPKNDDGSRIELLPGAVNGDNNGEHWRVTTRDGIQYHFGLNRLPGFVKTPETPETNSAWTVPVYGNNVGEQCYNATFTSAMCVQAWRWNLDYVVDPRGNAMTYFYEKDLNYYARNRATATEYVRGGRLTEIRYGLRSNALYARAPMLVKFETAERCLPVDKITCSDAQFTPANANHWPDTPVEQYCKKDTSCAGKISPTFWSRRRLTGVSTFVWGGTAYRDVDTWTLRQSFPKSDSSTPALWLEGITHVGKVDGKMGKTESLPETTFGGSQRPNRVEGVEGIAPMVKYRVRTITSESGGITSVNYSEPECVNGALPTPDSNTKRCYPTYWTPDGATKPVQDWFHKYVTTQVSEDDRVEGTPDVVTTYDYKDLPAWHFDDDDGLTKESQKTWSQWRGYGHVKVRKGAENEQRSETDYFYFRGMNGDKQTSGTPRPASVTDSENVSIPDEPGLLGSNREEIERPGPDGAAVSAKINDPWLHGPTATRARKWGTTSAYVLNIGKVRTRVPLSAGGFRRTETSSAFGNEGLLTRIDDQGDTAVTGDERCTRNTYARNETAWMLAYLSQVEVVSVGCGTPPSRPAQVISDERTHYDGKPFGTPPTAGLPTRSDELGEDNTYKTTDRTAYDPYGRVIEQYDARDVMTKITYTPDNGPVTKVSTTNALQQTTSTELDPAWGEATAVIDPSGKRTEKWYDPLGRLRKAWLPGRPTNGPASEEYEYLVRKDGPMVVTTRELRNDASSYNVSHELFDGMLRPRQRQTPAPGGGRVLVDTIYDSRGLEVKTTSPYYNEQAPATELALFVEAKVPGLQETVYDGAERPTRQIFKVLGARKWETTTTYDGDRVTVDPPDGETATTSMQDVRGNTVELRQYHGDSPTGGYDTTSYTYTPEGEVKTIVDPAGNVRSFDFDVRGHLKAVTDPNSGTTTHTYDAEGRLETATSGGRTITYKYDDLDRLIETWEGKTQLTGYKYDTLVPGELTSSTRFVNGNAYTTTITGYDEADRPLGTTITIPASEGKLAGTYTFGAGYNLDGSLAKTVYPNAGGLPGETVRHEYSELGLPTTTTGATSYVTESGYSKVGEPTRTVFSTGAKSAVRVMNYEEGTRRLKNVVTEKDGAQRVGDISYDYDEAGNIIKTSDRPPNVDADNECFRYDHLQRLTEAWTPQDGDCEATRTTASLGGPAPYWHSYKYDKAGNRKEEIRRTKSSELKRTYATPDPGPTSKQPNTVTSVTNVQGGTTTTDTFGYDAVGNTNRRVVGGKEQKLDWTLEGNLEKVTEGTKETSYVYDASGERLIRKEPNATTLYLGGMELKLVGDQVTGLRYYKHGGDTVAVRSGSSVQFLFGDHHNTDEIAINAATMAVTQRRFDPFGQLRGSNPTTWVDERSFVGGTADASTGLIHLGAREYDPVMGRFISVDPVVDPEDPQQLHGYAYANNSPETFADPDGLLSFRCGWCSKAWSATKNTWNAGRSYVYRAYTRYVPPRVRNWVTKKVNTAKSWAKDIKRKVVKKVKSIGRSIKKWGKQQLKNLKKNYRAFKDNVKRFKKSVKENFKKGIKKAWENTKKTGKWLKDNAGPGTPVWTWAKIGLGVAAFAACTVCAIAGGVALAMSAVDVGVNIKKQDYGAALFDVVGAVPGLGLATKVKTMSQSAGATAQMLNGAARGTQVQRAAQLRADRLSALDIGLTAGGAAHFVLGSGKDIAELPPG